MKNVFIYLLAITFSSFTLAQELKFSQKPKLIYDYNQKEAVLFKNDSVVIKTKQKQEVPIFKETFPGNFDEYIPVSVENRNLFVHEGCGPVLEFKNDSLIRIDSSFLHKNQFLGSIFTFKNEIYIFGGYGLFTSKKIITKYNFKTHEWDLEKTNDEEIPTLRDCLTTVIGNSLFVYGGYNNDDKFNNMIYRLNLVTKNWEVYKSNITVLLGGLSKKNSTNLIRHEMGLFAINEDKIYEINFKTNTIHKYKNDYIKFNIDGFIINDTIYNVFNLNENPKYKYEFKMYPLKKHITNYENIELISSVYNEDNIIFYLSLFFVLILILLTVLVGYKKRFWFVSIIKNTAFVYSIKTKSLFYKGKYVHNLSAYDIIILERQFQSKNNFFALSDLNDLFADPSINESMDVLIKRRETKLNGFIKTITAVSGLRSEKICAFKKNETDKRIKEIQILPNAITYI